MLGDLLNYVFIFFDLIIYSITELCYVLFAVLCEMDATVIGEGFVTLIERIKVFLGVAMLFIVAFNLLKMLVDPTTIEQATSQLVRKIAVAIVLLICSNFIFDTLSKFQTDMVSNKRIEMIITGEEPSESVNGLTGLERYVATGKYFSYNLLFAFVNIDEVDGGQLKKNIMGTSATDRPTASIWDVADVINNAEVTYRYPIISGAVGILLAVIFVSFAIDVGVRAFTLILLQVISPIPIIMYITPKGDAMLSKFMKTYIGTYLQLFIKIIISYVTLYLMQMCMAAILGNVADAGGAFKGTENVLFPIIAEETVSPFFRVMLLVIVFVALFMMAKKLPQMLSDVTGIDFGSTAINPFKVTGSILKTGAFLGMAGGGALLGSAIGAAGAIGTGAGAGGVAKAALRGLGSGAQTGYGLRNSKSLKDVVSRGYTGTRDNFRNQRTYAQGLGDQGGNAGARAIRKDDRKNAEARRIATANLATINEGEEIRNRYKEAVQEAAFKNNASITTSSGATIDLSHYKDSTQYVEDSTAAARAKLDWAIKYRPNDSAAIKTAQQNLNNATAKANDDLMEIYKQYAATATSVAGSKAATEFGNYKVHVESNEPIYHQTVTSHTEVEVVHTNVTKTGGIRETQQDNLNNANTNATATAAATARARGAANAASRGGSGAAGGGSHS